MTTGTEPEPQCVSVKLGWKVLMIMRWIFTRVYHDSVIETLFSLDTTYRVTWPVDYPVKMEHCDWTKEENVFLFLFFDKSSKRNDHSGQRTTWDCRFMATCLVASSSSWRRCTEDSDDLHRSMKTPAHHNCTLWSFQKCGFNFIKKLSWRRNYFHILHGVTISHLISHVWSIFKSNPAHQKKKSDKDATAAAC